MPHDQFKDNPVFGPEAAAALAKQQQTSDAAALSAPSDVAISWRGDSKWFATCTKGIAEGKCWKIDGQAPSSHSRPRFASLVRHIVAQDRVPACLVAAMQATTTRAQQ